MNGPEPIRSYYLPPWRSIWIGVILMSMGTAFTFGMISYSRSAWGILQQALISFEDLGSFLFSMLMLFFKALFFAGGYLYLRHARGVERARLDRKGFYYRDIPVGNRMEKVAMDAGPLKFVSYTTIDAVFLKSTFWSGTQLYLTTGGKTTALSALGVLKRREKEEIVAIINIRIPSARDPK